jgi:hypothetical protein
VVVQSTLVFSVCDNVATTCVKYKDWRGNCPKTSPRIFSTKYGKSLATMFRDRSEPRSGALRRLKELSEKMIGTNLWGDYN